MSSEQEISNSVIVRRLTKQYGSVKAIDNVSFRIGKGEIVGFLGPNGAGKTTTIRHLMGFVRADLGECFIGGKNCWDEARFIQKKLGYLPGELSLMEDMTGEEFIRFAAQMRELKTMRRADRLIERFELDTSVKIRKMSKGMKQKVGIVCAFMHNPNVLILDEPTSGLDPLMQNRFVELLLEEKELGKTIFLSSHMFDEVEKTCDRIGIIKEGKLVAIEHTAKVRSERRKTYLVTFETYGAAEQFRREGFDVLENMGNTSVVSVKGSIQEFIKALEKYPVTNLDVKTESLEEIFMHYYGGDKE